MRGVSIVIKCFNEEHKIDAAIASALAAGQELAPIPVEVVVADSRSTDATAARAVQWARNLSVRVVQLLDPEQRGCGLGVELGFRCSIGERVLLMDGDMVVQPGFIRHAMRYLDQHPRCAGVAGLVSEASLRNGTDRIRVIKGLNRATGAQPWLNGGGLYRRAAVLAAGGFAGDTRLAAFEEADLGLRLERQGWSVQRLREVSMVHHGHPLPAWKVLAARWKAGRFEAAGRLLKLHGFKSNGWRVWRLMAHPLLLALVWMALAASAVVASTAPGPSPMVWLGAGVVGLALIDLGIKRNLPHALTSWMDWHLMLLGLVIGVLRPLPDRLLHIDHRVLAEAGHRLDRGPMGAGRTAP